MLPYDVGPSDSHCARSDALVRRSVEPTVWPHSTDSPTLILGAAQQAQSIDAAAARARGVRVVRRQAGGTSVFAGPGVLGLDVVLPAEHRLALADVVEAYRWIGELWAQTLGSFGIPARTVSVDEARAGRPARPTLDQAVRMACFGTLSPYEVAVESRKLVGLAQVRRQGRVLWQTGLHSHFDHKGLAALLVSGDDVGLDEELRRRAVGLDELLSNPPDVTAIVSAFLGRLSETLGVNVRPGDWTDSELQFAPSTDA